MPMYYKQVIYKKKIRPIAHFFNVCTDIYLLKPVGVFYTESLV